MHTNMYTTNPTIENSALELVFYHNFQWRRKGGGLQGLDIYISRLLMICQAAHVDSFKKLESPPLGNCFLRHWLHKHWSLWGPALEFLLSSSDCIFQVNCYFTCSYTHINWYSIRFCVQNVWMSGIHLITAIITDQLLWVAFPSS